MVPVLSRFLPALVSSCNALSVALRSTCRVCNTKGESMKHLYVISIKDAKGNLQAYNILAGSMAAAVAKAQQVAGVDATVDPHTFQKLATVDHEA